MTLLTNIIKVHFHFQILTKTSNSLNCLIKFRKMRNETYMSNQLSKSKKKFQTK